MPLLNRSLPLATLALALLVTGCNVLDSAYDEGGSVDDLLVDANIARQSGDLDHAIELLAQAYEQDPARADVRLDYASTLMQRD
ncbi:MAG: tetratricopeptide repeat protein, partial [Rhodothermales bacterium]|nr:tetratricopeptide repeat protein [Rhodothermales bacterium]